MALSVGLGLRTRSPFLLVGKAFAKPQVPPKAQLKCMNDNAIKIALSRTPKTKPIFTLLAIPIFQQNMRKNHAWLQSFFHRL